MALIIGKYGQSVIQHISENSIAGTTNSVVDKRTTGEDIAQKVHTIYHSLDHTAKKPRRFQMPFQHQHLRAPRFEGCVNWLIPDEEYSIPITIAHTLPKICS